LKLSPIQSSRWVAALLIFISAMCFSAKAVIIKLAYRYDIDSISLLTLRMIFAMPFFLAVAWYARPKKNMPEARLTGKEWGQIMIYGLLGYYFASLFDFMGLQFVTASLERLILFVYPTIVLVLSAVIFRKKITPTQMIALVLTYLGISVAFLDGADVLRGSNIAWGGFLIFLSAVSYAVYLIGTASLLPKLGTLRYTSLAISVAGIAIILHHGLAFHWKLWHYPPAVYGLSFLMAILSTVLPTFLVSEGVRRIGPGNAAIIASIGPVATIGLGYWFLGEGFGFWQLTGTLLVMTGVVYISTAKG
jgi:drug/metabolite transporter (DMT)-like permease